MFSFWWLFSEPDAIKSLKNSNVEFALWPLKMFLSLRCCCMLAHRLPALGNSCEIYSSFPPRCCFPFLFCWACPWPSGQAAFHSVFMQPVSTWDQLSLAASGLLLHTTQQRSISASWTRRLRQGHEGPDVPSVGFWSKISIYIDYRLAMVTYTAEWQNSAWNLNDVAEPQVARLAWLVEFTVGMRERCNVLPVWHRCTLMEWDWQACRRTRTWNGRLLLVEKGLFLGLRRHPLCGWRMQLTTFTPYGIHWIIQSFELH